MLEYPATMEHDDNDTILLQFLDFPEAVAIGEDEDDALLNAVDILEIAIAERIARREEVPAPSKASGQAAVALPTLVAAKVLLYQAMREEKVRKAELARRLHARPNTVERLLDLKHASRMDQLDAAFATLGLSLDVRLSRNPDRMPSH